MPKNRLRRAAALLLAAGAAYTLTVREGFLSVRENATGRWVVRSQIPAEALNQRDRLLVELGLSLRDRADFTRAMEDFCS